MLPIAPPLTTFNVLSEKKSDREGRLGGWGGGVHHNPSDNRSASVGYIVRARVQTRVLFTSGAVAHYNGVNEEQM